ncbi:hypothetical protein Ancab_023155, partial [Ancistrocladus abbreviatus]
NVNLSSLNSPSSTIKQRTRGSRVELDLACLECFTDGDDIFEVSSGTISELQSQILAGNSELDFSEEYTPSLWLDIGSEFSDKSFDSTPSSESGRVMVKKRFEAEDGESEEAFSQQSNEKLPNISELANSDDAKKKKKIKKSDNFVSWLVRLLMLL